MKKVSVEIRGTSPLLMNSPKGMILATTGGLKSKTAKYDTTAEAEKVAYRKDNDELYIPAEALKGTIVNASAYKKIGKFAARPLIAGGCHIKPLQVGLGVKTYDIDLRTVVIQRARVVKARPKLEKWTAKFTVEYNEKLIEDPEIIRTVLEDAGQRVGILDFRPQKLGSFGMFEVIKWLPEK